MTSPLPVPEEPLHVRVARALGCKPVHRWACEDGWHCLCAEGQHALVLVGLDEYTEDRSMTELARYDEDWSATGPLIEKYGIDLSEDGGIWEAGWAEVYARAQTPLEAVCLFIIMLKEHDHTLL